MIEDRNRLIGMAIVGLILMITGVLGDEKWGRWVNFSLQITGVSLLALALFWT